MKRLLTMAIVVLAAQPAHAELVTVVFEGIVTMENGGFPGLVGQTISGSYVFEDTTPPSPPPVSPSFYPNAVNATSVTFAGSTLTIDTGGSSQLSLTNDPGGDSYFVGGQGPGTLDGASAGEAGFAILLFDPTGTMIDDTSITTIPSLIPVINFATFQLLDAEGVPAFSAELTSLQVAADCRQLTELASSKVWLGLKNSDDVGTKFDLLAEVLVDGSVVSSGQLNNVRGGSSGFNNAVLRTINQALSGPLDLCAGSQLSLRLSVRIAVGVSGHRSGTARLWFNDTAADSRLEASIDGAPVSIYLRDAFMLEPSAGAGPKETIDVFVDRLVNGNPFKPFGTWEMGF
jgi:hypothetical protein